MKKIKLASKAIDLSVNNPTAKTLNYTQFEHEENPLIAKSALADVSGGIFMSEKVATESFNDRPDPDDTLIASKDNTVRQMISPHEIELNAISHEEI